MVEMKTRRLIPKGLRGRTSHQINGVCMCVEEDSRINSRFLLWEDDWNSGVIS